MAHNYLAAGMDIVGMMGNLSKMAKACFTGETEVRTLRGFVRFDALQDDDQLASCHENDPFGIVEFMKIDAIFENYLPIWNIHVNDKVIRTTEEHPFYVWGKGWVATKDLEKGDRFRSDDGREVTVEEIFDTGVEETVYNCSVSNYHTYFIGANSWRFAIWAHNTCGPRGKSVSSGIQDHHAIPWNNKTYNHQNNPLVKLAKVDLQTFGKNLRAVEGHAGRHSATYHQQIQNRLNTAFTNLKTPSQAEAQKALNRVIKGIWRDIKNGKLAPYDLKDVIVH